MSSFADHRSSLSRYQRSLADSMEVLGHEVTGICNPVPEVGQEGGTISRELERRIVSKQGSGAFLNADMQREMERTLGVSLEGVRVHHDHESDVLSRTLNASAFTLGNDIYLSSIASPNDRELMAHELTHTVQQRSMESGGSLAVGPVDDHFEQDADSTAQVVLSSKPSGSETGNDSVPRSESQAPGQAVVQRQHWQDEPLLDNSWMGNLISAGTGVAGGLDAVNAFNPLGKTDWGKVGGSALSTGMSVLSGLNTLATHDPNVQGRGSWGDRAAHGTADLGWGLAGGPFAVLDSITGGHIGGTMKAGAGALSVGADMLGQVGGAALSGNWDHIDTSNVERYSDAMVEGEYGGVIGGLANAGDWLGGELYDLFN
ncbi:MAG: hypothetical protein NPIRA04_04900 [Nitrospirales bacterium]|nr:MAG: hypothetical protein NPIRA04_04900 [Nitrospirales bacterium]